MSPEIAMRKEYSGASADVWALGVILYILLTGKLPFSAAYEGDLVRKIQKCKYVWPSTLKDMRNQPVEISRGAKNLVRKILAVNEL